MALDELEQDTLKLLAVVNAQLQFRKALREKSDEVEAQRRLSEERLAQTEAMAPAEDERKLLNAELSHRMKNTLAMVLAIAARRLKMSLNVTLSMHSPDASKR